MLLLTQWSAASFGLKYLDWGQSTLSFTRTGLKNPYFWWEIAKAIQKLADLLTCPHSGCWLKVVMTLVVLSFCDVPLGPWVWAQPWRLNCCLPREPLPPPHTLFPSWRNVHVSYHYYISSQSLAMCPILYFFLHMKQYSCVAAIADANDAPSLGAGSECWKVMWSHAVFDVPLFKALLPPRGKLVFQLS